MTELVWTANAVRDLTAISSFIARDSDSYAHATVDRLLTAAESLIEFPRSGRQVPEVRKPNIRELIVEPYRVIYRTRPAKVEVLSVIHSARSLAKVRPRPWNVRG